MKKRILALIPARYQSSRFPGKPLAIINGKPMIQRVYEQTAQAFEDLCVATDDQRIADAVAAFGGKAVMTATTHNSGTERCLEALHKFEAESGKRFDVVINVQGDEPYIHPQQLLELAECFNDEKVEIATLVKRISSREELFNYNTPKVILNSSGYALYFSRTPIPFARGVEMDDNFIASGRYYKHIGLYGYRASTLAEICALPKGYLEGCEKLEQLRWLENGKSIKVALTEYETHAVDTPEDMMLLNSLWKER